MYDKWLIISDDTPASIFKKQNHIGVFVCFPIDALTGGEGSQDKGL